MMLSFVYLLAFLVVDASATVCNSCCHQGVQGPPGTPGLPGSPGSTGMAGIPGSAGRDGIDGNCIANKSAFTAIKTNSQTGDIGDVVTFQQLQTNINNDFNLQTNKFTCQVPGTYFFTFAIGIHTGVTNNDPIIGLMKNGVMIVNAHSRIGTAVNADYDHSTNSAILNLDAGDDVWIAFHVHNGRRVHSDSNKYTSFSGFLLYSD